MLKLVTDEFDRLGVPYRVVGSVASSHLGVMRATADVDVVAALEWFRAGDEVSDRQWNDILGIIRAQRDALDLEYARRWAFEIGVLDLLERAVKEGQS